MTELKVIEMVVAWPGLCTIKVSKTWCLVFFCMLVLHNFPLLFLQFNHQGTITVNEEGTEAASVTTVAFMPLSAQIRFIIDRPFIFLIYEHRTNCLLFMGRVVNPNKL